MIRAALVILAILTGAPARADDAILREAAKGGYALLVRHAFSPFLREYPNPVEGDCATQRNIDALGAEQSRRWGERLRAAGIAAPRLLSSQWCRTVDTATLMGFGPPEIDAHALGGSLQSFRLLEAKAAFELLLETLPRDKVTILVSHHTTIALVTSEFIRSAEMVVVKLEEGGAWRAVARLQAEPFVHD